MTTTLQAPLPGGRVPPTASDRDCAELFVAWQRDHDGRARDRLVERYMPLARSLARRYASVREPLDDLLQIASYGLLGAIDRFEVQRGVSFSTFAVPTILGELRRYLRDFGWSVSVPRGAQERAGRVEAAIRQLTSSSQRDPTVTDLAGHLGWSVEEVLDALQASAGRHTSSLDLPVGPDGDPDESSLIDFYGQPDAGFERVDEELSIGAAARTLPRHARRVVEMRFVEDLTQAEIAHRLGVSQMTVSRLLRSSLEQMRRAIDG